MEQGFTAFLPLVGPWQLYGIEINRYAYELAQMTVWIGYLQWTRENGFGHPDDPVLRPMDTFECKDAILDLSDPENPKEPTWPKVDFVVGNPPFLGGNKIRQELKAAYVEQLFDCYIGAVPASSDLCCYWFEQARRHIEAGRCRRVGLLATQGIRGGANRRVLQRIVNSGDIFFAESDRPWVLDGANVHVSMVGFCETADRPVLLDGEEVNLVNSSLGSGPDMSLAEQLPRNGGLGFRGNQKGGSFDLPVEEAILLLTAPNPNGQPSSNVLRPVINGDDLVARPGQRWLIDFNELQDVSQAAGFHRVFERAVTQVKEPFEAKKVKSPRRNWWKHERPRPEMRSALNSLRRFLVTPHTSKFRCFSWLSFPILPDHQLIAFARSDDYFFGVLHSRLHEVWALRLGTRLETRPRYTPTTCFETFPFPWPPGEEPIGGHTVKAISEAAGKLNDLRETWLNPPEWTKEEVLEFPGSVDGPWKRFVHSPDERGIGTV